MSKSNLCDKNCNECPLISHGNSKMISAILNTINFTYDGGDELAQLVNSFCPNLTVCPECHIDDFYHSDPESGYCTPISHAMAYRVKELEKKGSTTLLDELTSITKEIASLTKRFEVVKQILNERALGDEVPEDKQELL